MVDVKVSDIDHLPARGGCSAYTVLYNDPSQSIGILMNIHDQGADLQVQMICP